MSKNRFLMSVAVFALCQLSMADDAVEAHWRWNTASSDGSYSFTAAANWVDENGASVRIPTQIVDSVVFDAESATSVSRVIAMPSNVDKGMQVIIPKIVDDGAVSGRISIRSARVKTNESWERAYRLIDPTAFLGLWEAGDVRPRWILPEIPYGNPVMQTVNAYYRPTVEVQAERASIGSLCATGGLQKAGSGDLVVNSLQSGCDSWFWIASGLLSFNCDAALGRVVVGADGASIGVEAGHVVSVDDMYAKGCSTLVKEGGGTLSLAGVGTSSMSVSVNGGRVSFGNVSYATDAPADNAVLWLDADDAESFEDTVSGLKWKDRRWRSGATGYALEGVEDGVGSPVRRTDALNGRGYVDFGWGWKKLENPSGERNLKSNAAFMTLSPSVAPGECFVVVRMKRPQGGSSRHTQTDVLTPSFFGCGQNYYTRLGSKSLVSVYGMASVLAGLWQVDGVPHGFEDPYPDDVAEFHVVNVALDWNSGNATVNLLARDQTGNNTVHIGGMEIAEEILYSRRLTVGERNCTLAYLMKKWRNEDLPASVPLARVPNLSFAPGVDPVLDADGDIVVESLDLPQGTSAFAKSGQGEAVVSNMAATVVSYDIDGGALTAIAANGPSRAPAFHVDASDVSSLAMFDEATGKVNRWYDTEGSGVYAQAVALQGESVTNFPMLAVSSGDDGLLPGAKYVDFDNKSLMNWYLPNGAGKYWNNPSEGKEIHLVISVEGESWALGNGGNNGLNNPPQAVPVFCATGSQMFREDTKDGTYNYAPMTNAYCLVDGDDTDYSWRRNAWPEGRHDEKFHVITVVMNGSSKFGLSNFGSRWGSSRSQYTGRIRLAEMVVYNTTTNALADAQAVHARLMRKWCGFAPRSISVCEGASLSLEPRTRTAMASLSSGSSIDVGDLVGVSSITAHFDANGYLEPIRIAQGVALADRVSVRVEIEDSRKVKGGTYDLLIAGGDVCHGASEFDLEIHVADGSTRSGRVVKTASGLALTMHSRGFTLVFR